MKRKKIVLIVVVVLTVVFVGGGGFFLVKGMQGFKKDDTKSESMADSGTKTTEKTDSGTQETAKNPDEGKPTPEVNTALGTLSGVTLTAYMMKEPTTSIDGKTTIPANSIQPYLYPEGSGVFSVQKLSGSAWIDVASNVSYPGHGGIAGAFTNSTEDSISYRVVKIENGRATAVSKTFTILRSDLSSGVKTYN